MLRAGAMILFTLNACYMFWAVLYLFVAVGFGWVAPHLFRGPPIEAIPGLGPEIAGMARCLAILCYAFAVGCFLLIHLTIWKGLIGGQKWAFWATAITMAFIQVMLFVADAATGLRWVAVTDYVVITAVALAGIMLSGYGFFKQHNDAIGPQATT